MHKQSDVGVSKMKAFREKRIVNDKMSDSFREHYSMVREYAQDFINQNPCTTLRIDVQQEPNPDSSTRTFIRVYVCLGSLKQGFRGCGREILGLDGCFMLAKATIVVEFNKKIGQLKSYNYVAYDWLMKIPAEQCSGSYFSGRAKCDLLLNNICEVFNRKWELTGIPCKHVLAAIYNMSKNGIYSFKINPCNGREMWPVVESRTVIITPMHKPQVGRPPKKRKKSVDELESQSCSSGKLSRKGKSVKCSQCENLGHNKKGCRGQGGASQAGGSSQQRQGARQAAGAKNVSSQATGSSPQNQSQT
ncbi:mutator type transposase [Tanacetum coccineum]